MHPIISYDLAQARLAEMRREADQYRLAHQCRASVTAASRVRAAVGRRLIRVGERLVPAPIVGSARIVYQQT